jgi:hypothetical protein
MSTYGAKTSKTNKKSRHRNALAAFCSKLRPKTEPAQSD